MKLLYKLCLSTLLIAMPAIMIIGFFSFTSTESALEEAISSQQLELTRQTMDKIDRSLYERVNNILTVAQDKQIETFLAQKSHDTRQIETTNAKLGKFALLTGPWDNLSLLDSTGGVLAAFDKTTVGQSILGSHVTQETLNQVLAGEFYYSDVFLDQKSNQPTMLFMGSVRNEQDPKQPTVGLVAGHLSWPVVVEILQGTSSGDVELFSEQGVKVAGNNSGNGLQGDAGANLTTDELAAIKNNAMIARHKRDREEVLASYAVEKGYLGYAGNRWTLKIETPTKQAFLPALNAALSSTLLVTVVSIVANGLLLFFVLRFIKPIQQLTTTARQIAAGDLTRRVSITSKDEIGNLAVTFNQMTDKLQALYRGLEDKVREKTAQLSEKVIEIEQKNAEDEAILESIGDGLIVVDKHTKTLLINPVAAAILGVNPKTDTGKSTFDLFPLYDEQDKLLPKQQRPLFQVLDSGQKLAATVHFVDKDKRKLALALTTTPVVQGGKTIGAIQIIRDITKEKEVDRMKTEFISLASHQLRTPLSAIKWFTEMLLSGDAGKLNTDQTDFATNIADSTERMIQLVNSLLNISRIESGRIMVSPQPTDLKELVTGIFNDLKAKIEQKRQTLIISVHQDLPKINLDPRLIGQVYLNLLTNAIKYTPKDGEISVLVSKKDGMVISQVTDNGYGIPKDQQDRVFQKFFRASNAVKVETDGTGLGLYLIKAVIESSGGKLWFESEEGKGTTFWFSIPLSGMKAKEGEVTLDA